MGRVKDLQIDAMNAEHEDVHTAIQALVNELDRSERGRRVKKDLRALLMGDISSLDGDHWDSVEALLKLYRAGYRGSVLEAL